MKTAAHILTTLLVYLALCLAVYLMLAIAVDYASFRTDIHFSRFKQA